MTLREAALAARHDLGKYVAMRVRWLPGNAGADELRAALAADLMRTRSGPGGDESACVLWARLRVPLTAAGIEEIDVLVADLAERAMRLDTMDLDGLRDTSLRALALGDALKALVSRFPE